MTQTALLSNTAAAGIHLFVESGRLRFEAPPGALTPELRSALSLHRDEIIHDLQSLPTACGVDGAPEDCFFDPPTAPCPECGTLAFWTNVLGEARCQRCSPPTAALRLLERSEAIRRRQSLPSRPEAVEMIDAMRSAGILEASPPGEPVGAPIKAAKTLPQSLPPAATCTRMLPDGLACHCPIFWLDPYDNVRCCNCQPPLSQSMVRRRFLVIGSAQQERTWEEISREPKASSLKAGSNPIG